MPKSRKEGWVDWTKCPARRIILTDLQDEVLSLEESVTSAEQAWDVYRNLPEFAGVRYEQFEDRLKDHRVQIKNRMDRASWEEAAFARDRQCFPRSRQEFNHRGMRVFHGSAAQPLLAEDVKNNTHETMPPHEFRNTRPEYRMFTLDEFRPRIYQEVRRQKFINHLEKKRNDKKEEQRGNRNYKFPQNKKTKYS